MADPGRRGVTTVAEGVETASRLAPVTAAGCSKVQGDPLGRPPTRDAAAITRLAARANDASGEKRDEHGADSSAAA